MITLRPFFLLLGRASVFWLGVFVLFCGAITVAGVANADSRAELLFDATFIANLWFPGAAGWIVGIVIQEFQHTSLAHQLPGVRSRLATGHLATGLVVTLVTTGLITWTSSTSPSFALSFVLGLGAYCAGGALQDPLSGWVTFTNALLVFLVFAMSRDLARIAGEHPWKVTAISLGVGAVALRRLFARSTFRRKPFRLSKPLPGSFSLEKSQRYELRRTLQDRSGTSGWRARYLGRNPWAWVHAALHETQGGLGWKANLRAIGRMWALGLVVVLYTWVDKGEMSFGEALARSLYDALFRSPHQAPFGEKGGPYPMVLIVIAGAGVVTALFNSVTLSDALSYPLSRLQRAQVAFRAGLVDVARFLFILGLGSYAFGHLMGLLVGYEARFDFMPFHFRVLMVTLVLMPLGHWGRLRLQEATRRKVQHTIVAVSFGVIAFVAAVAVCVYVLSRLLLSPIVELIILVAALLVSQLLYRQGLTSYYRTADLA